MMLCFWGVLVTGPSGHRGLPVSPIHLGCGTRPKVRVATRVWTDSFHWDGNQSSHWCLGLAHLTKGGRPVPRDLPPWLPPTSSRVPKELSTQGLDSMPSLPQP